MAAGATGAKITMLPALVSQIVLLAYHQVTTWFDLHPFNGVRHYSTKEKLAEAGANAVLMSLAPMGFALHVKALMTFGVVYYPALFAIELTIWWVPYFIVPAGRWRAAYNWLLSVATSNFKKGDTLDHWIAIHHRLHRDTITALPSRPDRPVPNLEHTILRVLTLVTAVLTFVGYSASR
jgi:hypothetical protein